MPDSLLGPLLGALHRTAVDLIRVQLVAARQAGVIAELVELTTGVAPSPDVAAKACTPQRRWEPVVRRPSWPAWPGDRGLAGDSVVPDAIVDVVHERLAPLPERATAELEVAAVLGERFELRTAMAASERTPDAASTRSTPPS